jgi:hypothetical protein
MSQAPGKEEKLLKKFIGSMFSSIAQVANPEPQMPYVQL